MKLSVCMIARNEAETLPRSLAALRDHVHEIIVADTGSRDETPQLAAQLGARVLDVPWRDDFSYARNATLAAATGDYCLVIDADEVVEHDGWPKLAAFLAGAPAHGSVTIVSDTAEGRVHSILRRLCRNDGSFRYVGRIHEQLVGPGAGGDTGLVALHSGYSDLAIARRDKLQRNLDLLLLDAGERPDDAYVHFQLGRTYAKMKRPAEAIAHFEAALARAPADAAYLGLLVVALGYALKGHGRAAAALPLIERHRAALATLPDLWFLEGLLAMETGDAARMLASFEHCLQLGETTRHETVEGVGSYRAHFNLGLYHELAGATERARHHYEAALQASPTFQPAAHRLERLPLK